MATRPPRTPNPETPELEEPVRAGAGNVPPDPPEVDGGDGRPAGTARDPLTVRLSLPSEDPRAERELALWRLIEFSTERLSYGNYARFLDSILQPFDDVHLWRGVEAREPHFKRDSAFPRPYSVYGSDAYDLLRGATSVFLMHEVGRLGDRDLLAPQNRLEELEEKAFLDATVLLEPSRQDYENRAAKDLDVRVLPYVQLILQKLAELPIKREFVLGTGEHEERARRQYGILRGRVDTPAMIELIWSYWYEQGMLNQTMNAIALRFQNKRSAALPDTLLHLALDPVRPLSSLMWGWIQDEGSRLTLARRAYEYDQEYGLTLAGKAVPTTESADRRGNFIECFHNLLRECVSFYKLRDNLTVRPDGFPLLNSITDMHLLLAAGANNSYGGLPWTARHEMMVMQWLLARPEFREFLAGRLMMPYAEPWMDRVDTMRMLQRWGDPSITSFHYLAHYGEKILLSFRWGNWSEIHDPGTAAAWADNWRPAVQTYVHHYRRVTGVDLGIESVDGRDGGDRYLQPSILLLRRLAEQRNMTLPPPASLAALSAPEPRRMASQPSAGVARAQLPGSGRT